jgi:dTDP-L-rhamnose 4-epimerase
MRILITGGAGFIGSELALRLIGLGHEVRVLDALTEQVHGKDGESHTFKRIEGRVDFHRQDVSTIEDWGVYLEGVDAIYHLAAETGTGQSMYLIDRYFKVNCGATAALMDYVVNHKTGVKKIIVTSSRAIYGEGKYSCPVDGILFPAERDEAKIKQGDFQLYCPKCGEELNLEATSEDSPSKSRSIYGLTKYTQEQVVIQGCGMVGIDAVALRLQNVYGPGQSLSNPYTGILSIFSRMIQNDQAINIFEDGKESRDFVFITDVVEALVRSLNPELKGVHVLNVGTGKPVAVVEVVKRLFKYYGKTEKFNISGDYRKGDIRHNFADSHLLNQVLGFVPGVQFAEGLEAFLGWVGEQKNGTSEFDKSIDELKQRGLFVSGK